MSEKLEKFHKYLKLYEKMVLKNAGNFVGVHLYEDVTQETFLKMYEHLDYLEDHMVKQWLLVVSGNVAKDYAKKGGECEVEPVDPHELLEQMDGMYESAEEGCERELKREAALKLVRTACDLLYEKNPNWYYIMIDSYVLEMTSPQIGEVLKLSTNYVDVMKVRARKYLHKKLGKQYDDVF